MACRQMAEENYPLCSSFIPRHFFPCKGARSKFSICISVHKGFCHHLLQKKRNLNHPRKNRKGGLWSVYPDGYSWDFGKKRGLQSHKYVIAYGFELFGLGRVAETPFPPPFPVEQVPELSAELLCPGMKEPIALGKSRRCFRQGRTIRRLCVPRRGYS